MKCVCCLILVLLVVAPGVANAGDGDGPSSASIAGVIGLNAMGWLGNGYALVKGERSVPPVIYGFVVGGVTVFLGVLFGSEWTSKPGSSETLIISGGLSCGLATLNLMQKSPTEATKKVKAEIAPVLRMEHGVIRQAGVVLNATF